MRKKLVKESFDGVDGLNRELVKSLILSKDNLTKALKYTKDNSSKKKIDIQLKDIDKLIKSFINVKEDVNVNDNDKAEMLSGIAQILRGVEDMSNRKELAKQQIIQLKKEGIEFDIKEFLQMCGFGGDMAGIETPSITSEMSYNDIHFKTLLKIYSRGGNLKRAIANYLFPNKSSVSQSDIAKELRSMNYDDVTELEKHLRIDIHKY